MESTETSEFETEWDTFETETEPATEPESTSQSDSTSEPETTIGPEPTTEPEPKPTGSTNASSGSQPTRGASIMEAIIMAVLSLALIVMAGLLCMAASDESFVYERVKQKTTKRTKKRRKGGKNRSFRVSSGTPVYSIDYSNRSSRTTSDVPKVSFTFSPLDYVALNKQYQSSTQSQE